MSLGAKTGKPTESEDEMIAWMISRYPPTNPFILRRWMSEATNPILKKFIGQWIEELEGKAIPDLATFQELMRIAKERGISPKN